MIRIVDRHALRWQVRLVLSERLLAVLRGLLKFIPLFLAKFGRVEQFHLLVVVVDGCPLLGWALVTDH